MKKYPTFQIDSFTKEKFKGNPAGVVSVLIRMENASEIVTKIKGNASLVFKTELEI